MRESCKFLLGSLHLNAVQEDRETRSEAYEKYVERVLERTPKQRVKTIGESWIDFMNQPRGCKES